MQYQSVVLGGTFDQIHKGHEKLLKNAFAKGLQVTIGLTSDIFVKTLKPGKKIAAYALRKQTLKTYLSDHGWDGRYKIIPIDDPYGPTILKQKEHDFDAIIVSEETAKTGEAINMFRKEQGLHPLSLVITPLVPAGDGISLSSTRIREGEVGHDGRLLLPESLRQALKDPIGEIVPEKMVSEVLGREKERSYNLVSVGDSTTKTILSENIVPDGAIIDFQVERQTTVWSKEQFDLLTRGEKVYTIPSGPGYISTQVIGVLRTWFDAKEQKKSEIARLRLIIDGEEDLLVLPAVVYAPLGTVLYYGQPGEGLIRVVVDEKTKKKCKAFLSQFTLPVV